MLIRPETPADIELIHHVTEQAFGRPKEARLIKELRANGNVILSLVAVREAQIVGHILFFPVVIKTASEHHTAVGLGPLAVLPQFQGQGIGSALVRAGLNELRERGHAAVIVLGYPKFYPRSGFVPASTYGISSRYNIPDGFFMATELLPNALEGKSGTVIYTAEFDEF